MSMNYIEDGLRQNDNALFIGLKWFIRLSYILDTFTFKCQYLLMSFEIINCNYVYLLCHWNISVQLSFTLTAKTVEAALTHSLSHYINLAIIQHLHCHLKQFISCHSSKTTNQGSRSLLPAQTSSTILSSLWPLAAGSLKQLFPFQNCWQ